jgi:NADH-quinone oxidoreductase subunit J
MQLPFSFLQLCFYSFAAVTLLAAMMVITSRNSVRAVLFLVLAFVGASGLWMLTQAEFLALTLVLVYVGAVMVLFLFVVMMLNLNTAPLKEGFVKYFPVGLLIAALLIGQLIWVYKHTPMDQLGLSELVIQGPEYSNIKHLGLDLYSNYLYPFEVAGAILLVAIVAAIALTFRGPRHRKKQNISHQIAVRKVDRLKVIKDVNPDSSLST